MSRTLATIIHLSRGGKDSDSTFYLVTSDLADTISDNFEEVATLLAYVEDKDHGIILTDMKSVAEIRNTADPVFYEIEDDVYEMEAC